MVRRPSGASRVKCRAKESAAAGCADKLARVGNDLAAHQRGDWPAFDRAALIGRVIHGVVDHRLPDGHFLVRNPDRKIRVAAYGDGALARMQAVELGGVGSGQCDEFGRSMRPLPTPSENRSPVLTSSPGTPFATFLNGALRPCFIFPSG